MLHRISRWFFSYFVWRTFINAIDAAINDLKFDVGEIPDALKDSHYTRVKTSEYLYPHAYKNHYVKQQYLPDSIKDSIYYIPQENKTEQNIKRQCLLKVDSQDLGLELCHILFFF